MVLGKQGAGKGTQCVRLSHHYVVPHISTGDMLRAAVKSGTPLGLKAKEVMDRGELLSDDLIIDMVNARLSEADARNRGFVLDGFPRTVFQAESLASVLAPGDIDLAIDLEVPTEQVLRRLVARRVCSDCGANYSTTAPPRVNWTCDMCGGEVVQRQDDTEDAIRRRLDLYEHETAPLISWYERRGQLAAVNGVGTADAVLRRVIRAIEARRGHIEPRPVRRASHRASPRRSSTPEAVSAGVADPPGARTEVAAGNPQAPEPVSEVPDQHERRVADRRRGSSSGSGSRPGPGLGGS